MANTLEYFTSRYLKGAGELKERCIQRWNLATDIFASGSFASGYFDAIKIDGPSPAGYILTSDADGWGTWQSLPAGVSTFLGLEDTPGSYINFEASGVRVNPSGNGLEFCAFPSGVSGSFTSLDGKTVTVLDGIITSIV